MRNFIFAAALAAMMAAAPVASASPAQQAAHSARVHGVVRAVDHKAHAFTLEDGRTFALPAGFDDSGLKAGEKVTVNWSWDDDQRLAREVTLKH